MLRLYPSLQALDPQRRDWLLKNRVSVSLAWLAGAVVLFTIFDRTPISNIPTLRTVAGVFGVALGLIWAFSRARTFRLRKGPLGWLVLMIAATLYVELSRYASGGTFTLSNFIQWFQALIFALILIDICRDYRSVSLLLWASGLALCVVAILGLAGEEGVQGRAGAETFNLNVQAYYYGLAAIGLLVNVLYRWPRIGLAGLLSLIGVVLMFMLMVRTGSRGGLAATLVGIAWVLFFMLRKRNVSAYVMIIPIILAVGALLFLSSDAVLRWERTLAGEDYGYRDVIWGAALDMFRDSPILGHGGGFIVPLGELTRGVNTSTHNQYLMLMLAYGLVGLLIWLALMRSVFMRCWAYRAHPSAIACMGMILSTMVFGVGGDLTFNRYYWVLVAVAANIHVLCLAFPVTYQMNRGRPMQYGSRFSKVAAE